MYQADPTPAAYTNRGNYFSRAEDWLDARGRFAWIIAMIAGFIVFWPIGLALLAYMIWGKKMFRSSCSSTDRRDRWAAKIDRKFAEASGRFDGRVAYGGSGNAAFDAYKSDMLRRLEDEQAAFEMFLKRLRDAKDKSEFDAFMEDRARSNVQTAAPEAPKGEY